MGKRKGKTPENQEDNRGSPRRRSIRISNVRGVVRSGVNPVQGMGGAQRRAKSAPTRTTLPQKTHAATLGANGRAAKAVAAGVVAAVAADAATGTKIEKKKGASLEEQPRQILGK